MLISLEKIPHFIESRAQRVNEPRRKETAVNVTKSLKSNGDEAAIKQTRESNNTDVIPMTKTRSQQCAES